MKKAKQNISILNAMGFTCDYGKTGCKDDLDWYSLECGWGFRLDAYDSIEDLIKAILDYKD